MRFLCKVQIKSFVNLFLRIKTFSNWHKILFAFSDFRQFGNEVRTWNGLKILVRDQTDLVVLDEVFALQAYEPKFAKVQREGVILDVGAHIGSFSLYAARKWNAKKVYSFEPCAENYVQLENNIKKNHLSNIIKPIPKAVWSRACRRKLFISTTNNSSHSLYVNNLQKERVCENALIVDCVTLKQILEEYLIEHVDYLKMDCEGAEWSILATLDKDTASKIDIIGMEYHFKTRLEFVELLTKLGFAVLDSNNRKKNSVYIVAAKIDLIKNQIIRAPTQGNRI